MTLLVLALLAHSVCGLLGWLGWLRFVRHVYDRSGAEAVRHVISAAPAYRGLLGSALRDGRRVALRTRRR